MLFRSKSGRTVGRTALSSVSTLIKNKDKEQGSRDKGISSELVKRSLCLHLFILILVFVFVRKL